jgi:hypothetical protein
MVSIILSHRAETHNSFIAVSIILSHRAETHNSFIAEDIDCNMHNNRGRQLDTK